MYYKINYVVYSNKRNTNDEKQIVLHVPCPLYKKRNNKKTKTKEKKSKKKTNKQTKTKQETKTNKHTHTHKKTKKKTPNNNKQIQSLTKLKSKVKMGWEAYTILLCTRIYISINFLRCTSHRQQKKHIPNKITYYNLYIHCMNIKVIGPTINITIVKPF